MPSEKDIITNYLTLPGDLPPMNYTVHDGKGNPLPNYNDTNANPLIYGSAPASRWDRANATSLTTGPEQAGGNIELNLLDELVGQTASMLGQQAARDADITALQNKSMALRQQVVNGVVQRETAVANLKYSQDILNEQLQSLFQIDPTEQGSAAAVALSQYDEANRGRRALAQQYAELQQISLLDDPLGYITAQLEMPKIAAQHNALAMQEDAAKEDIANRAQMLREVKSVTTAKTADDARAVTLQIAQAKQQEAQANLYSAQAESLSALGARELQRLQLSASLTQKQITKETAVARNKELEAVDEEKSAWNQRAASFSASLGMQAPITFDRLAKMTGQERDWWIQAVDRGTYGANLYESLAAYDKYADKVTVQKSNRGMHLAWQEMQARGMATMESEAQAQLQARSPGVTPKRSEVAAAAADLYERRLLESVQNPKAQFTMSSAQFDEGRVYNPMRVNPILTAEFWNKSVKKPNPVVTRIGALATTDAGKATDLTSAQMQEIMQSLVVDVRAGKISAPAAAEAVTSFFKAGTDIQHQMTRYDLFGLPKAEKYYFTLEGNWFGSARTVDMLDKTDVENAISKAARQRSETIDDALKLLYRAATMR